MALLVGASVCVCVFNLFAVYTYRSCPRKLYNGAYEQCARSQKMSPVIRAAANLVETCGNLQIKLIRSALEKVDKYVLAYL